jgi:predicted hydrocarbon binding protein
VSSEKTQEIARLVDKVGKADQEFGSELLLIAEKLLLQKLTRNRDSGSHLNSIPALIQKAKGKSENSALGENRQDTNLARGFSAAVEMLEGMDSDGLTDMISLLRETSGPEPVHEEAHLPVPEETHLPVHEEAKLPVHEEAHLAPANVATEEALPHIVSCLKRARLQPMQKALYDKFGDNAPQRLYNTGEVYGKRIALEFRNKGLGLEKMIRDIERVAKLAGWGDFSFHRVDARSIECTIQNTIFSYKREGVKNSCYFASGIAGGIISAILAKVGYFVARETECVSDGHARCKFEMTVK